MRPRGMRWAIDLLRVPENRRLLLVLAVLALSAIFLWQKIRCDPGIAFLTQDARADWILYPIEPEVAAREQLPLTAEFSTRFLCPRAPGTARVHVRALRSFRIRINGSEAPQSGIAQNWKLRSTVEVAPLLRAGENEIVVAVSNPSGPPALWLWVKGDGLELRSNPEWTARLETLSAMQAQTPTRREWPALSQAGPFVGEALRDGWPGLLAVFLVATGLAYVRQRVPRLSAARFEGPRSGLLTWGVTAGAAGVWLLLFINNLPKLHPMLGFDAPWHAQYLNYILEHHSLPPAGTGGLEMYQPPLFYGMAALLFALVSSVASQHAATLAVKFIPFLSGLGQILVTAAMARWLLRGDGKRQALAIFLAAIVPMNLYISQYLSNESPAAFLISVVLLLTVGIVAGGKFSLWRFLALGAALGLALLTKFTALLVLPPVLVALIYALRRSGQGVGAVLVRLLVLLLACTTIAGVFYLRRWLPFETPCSGDWDPLAFYLRSWIRFAPASGSGVDAVTGLGAWWQDPGYHVSSDYLRFGRSLLRPVFSGFYSFPDSIYSTFWGDAYLAGGRAFDSHLPWSYGTMALIYPLAVPATLLMLTGLALMAVRFVRAGGAEWLAVLGVIYSFGFGLLYMTLNVPSYAQAKAFFGLFLVPLLAIAFGDAAGRLDEWLQSRRYEWLRAAFYGWLATLAAFVLRAFFITKAGTTMG